MINTKITFILGAGASCHLGYPLGMGLVKSIIRGLSDYQGEMYNLAARKTRDVNLIHKLRDELHNSYAQSIDTFLEFRPEFTDLGKFCIAFLIGKIDAEINFGSPDKGRVPDWYEYVWNKYIGRLEHISNSGLKIITYNYDTSLERFLYHGFKNLYNVDADKAWTLVKNIGIVHVHGCLSAEIVTFDGFQSLDSSRSIKVIHDGVDHDAEYLRAREYIRQSDKLVFLGFGYHPVNLDRLSLAVLKIDCEIRGSAIGMGAAQVDEAIKNMKTKNSVIISNSEKDCTEYLRQKVSIF